MDMSVIIPVYNLEKHLIPMLNSLAGQRNKCSLEIMFVLNNCTDRSEDIIRKADIPNSRIYQCYEQGCGLARNKGMEEASGEYIWFMDGDDWLLNGAAIQTAFDFAKGKDIIRIPFLSNRFTCQHFSMVWQYIYRKEFINEFRFRKKQPSEDDAFNEQVLAKAGYLGRHLDLPTVDNPLYFYNYLREGSNMYRTIVLHEEI